MSLRCIFVICLSSDGFGKVLIYRQFPTVERRCKRQYQESYTKIPSPNIFASNLLVRLGLSSVSKQYVDWRDKANGTMQLPVVEIQVDKKPLWPIIAVAQSLFLVCCIPFVEETPLNKEEFLKIPSISTGLSVLFGIVDFLGTVDKLSWMIDLDNYLTLTMPFGTSSDTELASLPYLNRFHSQKFLKRQPAWKPFVSKGKQQIVFKIMEFVRTVESDQSGGVRRFETFGEVSARADVEGAMNDVSVSLSSSDASHPLSLDAVTLHPSVSALGPSALGSTPLRRLRFCPPAIEFVMLRYCSLLPKEPPIKGVFKMLGDTCIELLVQLKLNEKVKNSFDYCDLLIVFFNRGPVKTIQMNANHGVPKLADDKYSLKWNIGSKFPKDLEVTLTAKLDFHQKPVIPHSDPFCVDKNCYAQVNFKQSNSTLSGLSIDSKNVTVTEGGKPKVIVERSVQSTEYRIWNNYGDLPFPTAINDKFTKLFT